MTVLALGISALFAACLAQVALVRLLQPRNHVLLIFAVFGFFCIFAIVLLFALCDRQTDPMTRWADVARLGLLMVSLSLAYVALYSAIEDDSPSMAMVKMAWQAGHSGCREDDLALVMDDRLLLDQRLEAMRRDGWILQADDRVILTPLGRFWAKLFRKVQILLRMDEGG